MSEVQTLSPTLTIDGLLASGPATELADKMMLFGQFVGDWEATSFSYDQDGTVHNMQGEIHFGWILEGRAVQDVWIFPTRPQLQAGASLDQYGTTIRFYDAQIDAWRIIWISPVYGTVRNFTARQVDDEIVIEGLYPQGQTVNWIFSQITSQSFHWRNVMWEDAEQKWRLQEEVEVRRLK